MVRWRAAMAAGLVATGVLGVPAQAVAAGTVTNPSFETLVAGKPDCWVTGGAKSDLTLTSESRTGKRAMQIRGRAAAAGTVAIVSAQSTACGIRVVPLHAYAIGAWYQATEMVTPVVSTYAAATGWRTWFTGAPYSGSTPWSKIETITPGMPAGTELISLGFRTGGTAKLVLDDAAVTDATALLATAVQGRKPAFTATFGTSGALVTNEYAYWNPAKRDAVRSTVWETTSGSLFAVGGGGYTGKLDTGRPDAMSVVATDSAIFRLRTFDAGFGNVKVAFKLTVAQLGSTTKTPATKYDGVHIWLRYRSQYSLYAVSVARRDGGVVLKKKCPGGPSNDGTYYTLGKEVTGVPIKLNVATPVSATVQNNPSGTVTLSLSVGGRKYVTATDTGIGCPAITALGSVGVRGDNARFSFHQFTVARNSV